jgi:ribosomal protein S20
MMSNVVIPSDDESKKRIRNALEEISNSMTRMSAERDLIKNILQDVEDDTQVPKKYLRKMANIFHKQNLNEVKAENDDVETLYETVV